jgi:hypothetical protein
MFKKFQTQHEVKFGELPIFEAGLEAYKKLLVFDADPITDSL